MRYVYLIALFLLTYQEALAASHTATLIGEISGDSPKDFNSLQVEIQQVGAIGPPLDRAYPSFDGRFEIHGVPEGQYTLQVKTPLGEPVYRDVVTIHSFDTRLSIKLPPASKERPVSGLVSVKQLQHKPPKAARKAFDRGVKMFEKGDLARSLASLEEAVALDPE